MVQDHARETGVRAEQEALDARRLRARDGDGAAVAAHPGEPEKVDLLERPEPALRPGLGVRLEVVLHPRPRGQAEVADLLHVLVKPLDGTQSIEQALGRGLGGGRRHVRFDRR